MIANITGTIGVAVKASEGAWVAGVTLVDGTANLTVEHGEGVADVQGRIWVLACLTGGVAGQSVCRKVVSSQA